jgi:hypothetical protein
MQSDSRKLWELKRQALRCLTVVFRDLPHYSRDAINVILRPSWKLLNTHLPVFTDVVCYKTSPQILPDDTRQSESEEESDDQDSLIGSGYESEDEIEEDEPKGLRGVTLQLLELLTTLIQRPNVQEVVRQGITPLMMTIGSYMLLEDWQKHLFKFDESYFLCDKTQSVFKVKSIRNQCIELCSSLIEMFGDQSLISLYQVIVYLVFPGQVVPIGGMDEE